jgi:hypothetical protein
MNRRLETVSLRDLLGPPQRAARTTKLVIAVFAICEALLLGLAICGGVLGN